jgi:hypothetical protein
MKMKKLLLLLLTVAFINGLNAQVGIGTDLPDGSAILDIESTDAGVLFPRLTTTERNLITNPATGLLVFNVTTGSFQYNFGTPGAPNWVSLSSNTTQSGTVDAGSTVTGWNYYDVLFATPFTAIPTITLTFREGTGRDNGGSNSIMHFKVVDAATTGFTIGINETTNTNDVFMDWIASPRTQ